MITPRSYVNVDPATSRLVERILEEWWENICKQPVAPLLGVDVKSPLLATSRHGANAQVVRSPSPYPMMRTSTSTSSNTSSASADSSPSPTLTDNNSLSTSTNNSNNTNSNSNDNSSGKQQSADLVLCA